MVCKRVVFREEVIDTTSASLVFATEWKFSDKNSKLFRAMPNSPKLFNPFSQNVFVLLSDKTSQEVISYCIN